MNQFSVRRIACRTRRVRGGTVLHLSIKVGFEYNKSSHSRFSYLFGMSCSGTVAPLRDSVWLQKSKFYSDYTFFPSEPIWWEWREG